MTPSAQWGATRIEALSRLGARGRPLVRHLVARGAEARPEEYARLGDRATVERLAAGNPDVLQDDDVGAVECRHHGLVEWLLANGATPDGRSRAASRHTALHSAAWNGDLEMVKVLLAAGADPAVRDEQYRSTPRVGQRQPSR